MSTTILEAVRFVGVIAGVLSISIAVFLQTMLDRRCNPAWVFVYFGVGSVLLLMNIDIAYSEGSIIWAAELLAYAIVVAAEIAGVVRILKNPIKELDSDLIDDSLLEH